VRIAFLVNRDLHACLALNALSEVFDRHTATIFYSRGVGRGAPPSGELAFLREIEQTLPIGELFPHVERHHLGDRTELRTFGQLAAQHGAAFTELDAPNSPAGLAALRDFAPDVIVSIRYGRILRDEAIATSAMGVLNLHSGVLPTYRGILATLRAMLAGDAEIGCTLHRVVDAGIDTGPIIDIARVPLEKGATLFDAVRSVYPPGARLITRALGALERGEPVTARAPEGEGAYFGMPTAYEFAELRRRGHPLFDPASYQALLARFTAHGGSGAAS
jgi:methionyl-tRNA formyltransferase